MEIQLIKGEFKSSEAMELLTQLIHTKIKFHENKIYKSETEEDIKSREAKIKKLQKDLYEVRENIKNNDNNIAINAVIKIG